MKPVDISEKNWTVDRALPAGIGEHPAVPVVHVVRGSFKRRLWRPPSSIPWIPEARPTKKANLPEVDP